MATATQTRSKSRSIRLERVPSDDRSGKLVITDGDESTGYLVTRLESQIGGTAFQLDKLEVETDGCKTTFRVYAESGGSLTATGMFPVAGLLAKDPRP